jgi:tripartite-type tricarboxylate transporter receptor subunit TctC
MLVPHGPMTLFPWIHRNLRYDPSKDFTPLGRVCVVDYALTTGPATPAKTIADYLQWARDPKNKASFGSPGAGTIPHFIGQGFTQRTQTDIVHVPYKGSALTMVDLMGGNVSLGVSPLADAIEHHRNGKVRILATTGSQRSTSLKDVPTLKEVGIDLVVDGLGVGGDQARRVFPEERHARRAPAARSLGATSAHRNGPMGALGQSLGLQGRRLSLHLRQCSLMRSSQD